MMRSKIAAMGLSPSYADDLCRRARLAGSAVTMSVSTQDCVGATSA